MMQPDVTHRLAGLAQPLAASLGLAIWGVEVAFGPRALVRVYVEGDGGVDIDQCAELSRLLGIGLDVEDIVPGPYTLEVSSPGLERIFFTEEQLVAFVDKRVEATLLSAPSGFPGRKKFRGMLNSYEGGRFFLAAEEIVRPGEPLPLVDFTFTEARRVKLLPELSGKSLPGKKSAAKHPAGPSTPEKPSIRRQSAEGDAMPVAMPDHLLEEHS